MLEGWPKVAANGTPLSDFISACIHDLHHPGPPSPAPGRASAFCLLFTLCLSPLKAHLTSSRVSKHLSSLIISTPGSLLQRYLSITILPLPALKPYILFILRCTYLSLFLSVFNCPRFGFLHPISPVSYKHLVEKNS